VYALAGDDLSGGDIEVSESGDLTIAAAVSDIEDIPGTVHAYTGTVQTDASGSITVRLLQEQTGEAVNTRTQVLIHARQTPEDGTFVYREERPVTTDGNQYGDVDHMRNQTIISTYSDETGSVVVEIKQPQGVVDTTVEQTRFWIRGVEFMGVTIPVSLAPPAGGLGLIGIGLFARRRRGDIQ
jgi:hypothetical protein